MTDNMPETYIRINQRIAQILFDFSPRKHQQLTADNVTLSVYVHFRFNDTVFNNL